MSRHNLLEGVLGNLVILSLLVKSLLNLLFLLLFFAEGALGCLFGRLLVLVVLFSLHSGFFLLVELIIGLLVIELLIFELLLNFMLLLNLSSFLGSLGLLSFLLGSESLLNLFLFLCLIFKFLFQLISILFLKF